MPETVIDAFRGTVAATPDKIAFRSLGEDGVAWTWREVSERAEAIAKGLHELGVGGGDQIALMLTNRPEFHVCDLAGILLGAATLSVYNTLAPEQLVYLLDDAGASVMIAEQAFLPVIRQIREQLARPIQVIVVDGEPGPGELSLDELMDRGRASAYDLAQSTAAVDPDTVITLIYTSGTTGDPKGVQLTHRNILAAYEGADGRVTMPDDARVISWLPAAHIAERMAHHYLPLRHGIEVTCCPDPRRIAEYLPQVRPTWFFAVPRVWEKLKSAVEAKLASIPGEQGEQIRAALAAAVQKVKLEQARLPVPAELAAAVEQADAAVFAGIRTQLGLDRIDVANVGASPTPPEVLEFFHAIGVPVSEIWGMSETAGLGASNPIEDIRIGTVGRAPDNVQLKLGEDGELLVKSDVVTPGYRNLPEKNRDTIVDGWLHTGDIATIDDDGYVRIIDRKKELIISSGGKNMSPALIESRLTTASPLIGQAVAIGDGRPYNTALIVLDPDALPVWARAHGIEGATPAELAGNEQLLGAIDEAVQAANARLSRVEQIKRYTVLAEEWLPAGDELTPTMKLRRRPIEAKYRAQIDAMYAS